MHFFYIHIYKFKRLKRRNIWWSLFIVIVVGGAYFWYNHINAKTGSDLTVKVLQGEFEVLVVVTGELQAKNFQNIMGPDFQTGVFRWVEYKIQDLIPEGTVVRKGDYIAEIDRTTAQNAIIDMEERIERQEVQVSTVRMDTSISLTGLRDEILNRKLIIKDINLRISQSQYEPPATVQLLQSEMERAQRVLEQQHRVYTLREQHCKNWMYDTERTLNNFKRQHEQMLEILSQFTIRAPTSGMVIYRRDRSGQKRRTGSTINPNDNVVATLPDLSVMMSKIFVNEIDISKVKASQQVRLGVDAFPDKSFSGVVTSVSNIGEQLANTDAKVFEVMIEVNESDPIMRPSMTTSNYIVINSIQDATFVSIDAIYSQDSIPFVYTKNQTKQIVVLGEANDNEIVIDQGLSAGDEVYVSIPEKSETWRLTGEELLPIIRERALEQKKAKEELERQSYEEKRARMQR